jgi:hypothetical protein
MGTFRERGFRRVLWRKKPLRVTVSHNKPKDEVMRLIDRSFDDLLRGIGTIPLQFVDEKRSWQGSVLTFSVSAKMGFVSLPIRGTIEVTDRDVTIDVDLGLFEHLIAPAKARQALTGSVRALLK